MAGVAPNARGCSTRLICPQANLMMKWCETSSCSVIKNLPCTFALNTAFRSLNLQSGSCFRPIESPCTQFLPYTCGRFARGAGTVEGVRFAAPVPSSTTRLLGVSLHGGYQLAIAVGTPVARCPPGGRRQSPTSGSHRTQRADFPHWARQKLLHSLAIACNFG
jgi:hypothetical protein